jgi:hypothetical protein
MRRFLPYVSVVVAAGCGGSGAAPPAGTTTAGSARVRATFRADTHRPAVGKPWPYSVRVTDSAGRPIRARIRMQVTFGGAPVGKVDGGRTFTFRGTWREPKGSPVIWPKRSRGYRLTFQAVVTARGERRTLNWWVEPT